MKNVGKYLFYFVFLLIGLLIYNEQVYAAQAKWPNYSQQIINSINDYYCSYHISLQSEYYSNVDIYLTEYNGGIYFIDPKTGEKKSTDLAWNASESFLNGAYGIINQKVKFNASKISNYLRQNGKIVCKELYFYHQGNDMYIYTPDDSQIEYSKATGKLTYKNNTCDILDTLQSVFYNEEKENALNGLQALAYSDTYHIGDSGKAQNYYNKYLEIHNKTVDSIPDANTFDMEMCSYEKPSVYRNLKFGVQQGLKTAISYYEKIIAKNKAALSEAKKNGDSELQTTFQIELNVLNRNYNNLNSVQENLSNKLQNSTVSPDNENEEGIVYEDCSIFQEEDIALINKILNYIKIGIPILLIVFGVVDFGQAVLSDDRDSLKKATNKFVKRCIIAVAIFFVPTIVQLLLNIFNEAFGSQLSTCGIK